ncbi:M23 family metallopeptidase [Leptolyngbya sp. FACHB-36]|uniref:M23 family metallopeptidase n=1 Tax=Leptolyngbya sp. FACHB-36 TaxID=2692808 RepID=UPI001680377B|nr:M23 family metallopeptidase [Leptolyngbya sp. FACHB-36]MBD2020389.1 M23 family metallopeptidase [Leptolyngbya sp. FACHB-36]
MLGILPLLLAEQPVKPLVPTPTPTPSELAAQQNPEALRLPTAIASPEATTAKISPSVLPQFSGAKPESLPLSLEAEKLKIAQPDKNWQQCDPSDMKFYETLKLDQISAIDLGKNTDILGELAESLTKKPKETEQQFAARKQEQQQVIEAKLAEIVASDRVEDQAQLQASVVTAATNAANQGKFEQARRLIQDPIVSPDAQAEVLSKISLLEAESAQAAVAQETGRLKLAESQRRAERARSSMRRIPSVVPTAIQPITVGPISLSDRGLGFAGATPIGRDYYNRALRPPGRLGNGNISLLFPLANPAPVTSAYGWRSHPVLGNQRFHNGVDIGAPTGTPVLAAYSGKVASADEMGGYGLAVVLEHNNGTQNTLYAHLSEILVRPGEQVTQGTVIGRVGSTGLSTGPHLHFEFRQLTTDGWITQDPGPQIEYALNQLVKSLQTAQQGPTKNGG